MEKAKQAVSNFVSKDGKHRTTVEEESRPAVTQEAVRPHQHENVTTAIDKEVHQDHHHTTFQPLVAKETLPEQHTHNMIPVEHKTFEHGNQSDVKATLDRDAAKYTNTSVKHDTTHSASVAPVIAGERTHHHVHEHVQPVIQKETIAPQVVHTTVPVHETHHAAPVHHGTSVLPAETLDKFSSGKGTLHGRDATKVTEFDGCPKPYKNELQTQQLDADKDMHIGRGQQSSNRTDDLTSGRQSGGNYALEGSQTGRFGGSSNTASLDKSIPRGAENTRQTRSSNTASNNMTTTGLQPKASMLDKINPMKDADRDGKAGLMD